ncbi:MAG: glycosyltransferase family 9 protein [Saprospiraceae bacterium]
MNTPLTKDKIKKVLIIRFSSIGDIVLTTPVIRCVKEQLNCEVHFLTKKPFESILISNTHLDKIYTINKKVSEVLPQLKLEKYDAIIDLHKNLRTLQIRQGLSVPYFSFDKLNWKKWLMVNLKINRLPKIHIVERYMNSVKKLGVVYDGKGLEPLKTEKQPLDDKIVFVIGGAHATKRLPVSKIISICLKIKSPIILLGGKEDATIGEEIVLNINEDRVINMCGKTTLQESIQLIKNARKIITHDTGMMHIAASFQKEIISVWGNTIPEFGMTPFYADGIDRNTIVQVDGLSCRPCSKIGFEKCPKGHFKCMMEIDEEKIVASLQ